MTFCYETPCEENSLSLKGEGRGKYERRSDVRRNPETYRHPMDADACPGPRSRVRQHDKGLWVKSLNSDWLILVQTLLRVRGCRWLPAPELQSLHLYERG